jgi:hypothetical protein
MIAAACTGSMTNTMSGSASEPTPASPPFEKPSKTTAGTASR